MHICINLVVLFWFMNAVAVEFRIFTSSRVPSFLLAFGFPAMIPPAQDPQECRYCGHSSLWQRCWWDLADANVSNLITRWCGCSSSPGISWHWCGNQQPSSHWKRCAWRTCTSIKLLHSFNCFPISQNFGVVFLFYIIFFYPHLKNKSIQMQIWCIMVLLFSEHQYAKFQYMWLYI